MNREAVFGALFTLLQTATGFKTFSRKLAHINDVAPEMMPYCAMVCRSQRVEQTQHTPPKYTLPVDLYVYVTSQGTDNVPQTTLNNCLDAIDAVLAKVNVFPETNLGLGNVKHVRVQGEIQTDEGTLGDFAVAVVPIEIIAA